MNASDSDLSEIIRRLSRRDPTLITIELSCNYYKDAAIADLMDCLLANPDVVKNIFLNDNWLMDETGVKLARYIAASSTIKLLFLNKNRMGELTYIAIAEALRINTSLESFHLFNNEDVNRARIETAFVDALNINPNRPTNSIWLMFECWSDEYDQLKIKAEELGHPTMQSLLATYLLRSDLTA
jgi:hypothetical protein